MLVHAYFFRTPVAGLAVLLMACTGTLPSRTSLNAPTEAVHVFTVQAPDGLWSVRALTQDTVCPSIQWDDNAPQAMALRAPAATVSARAGAAQSDNKAAVFDVRTCEANWPAQARRAKVAGIVAPAPAKDTDRILIIADTGCRMKGSDNAFQACNDPVDWPFAQVAQSAAQLKPDLVVHIGDIHYRESPCPDARKGCAGATWGYGWDAWRDDFFTPARPLLAAVPWVFVRGNHESCHRAGQGWFRFVDALPYNELRSCNDPTNDGVADFSEPFAVTVAPDTQFLVFDSSKTSGKPYAPHDPAFVNYQKQWQLLATLAKQKPQNFFLSHHPLLAVSPTKDGTTFRPAGSGGIQSAFASQDKARLFPAQVNTSLHGHLHVFESLSFSSGQPVSLVLGNSGSLNEGKLPAQLASHNSVYPGAVVEDYAAHNEYGFATLDRVKGSLPTRWRLTAFNKMGKALIQCDLNQGHNRCQSIH